MSRRADGMTVRDLIERLQQAPYDGMSVLVRDEDNLYGEIEFTHTDEKVAAQTCVVLVVKFYQEPLE